MQSLKTRRATSAKRETSTSDDLPPLSRCPPLGPDRKQRVRDQLASFVASPALAELVELYGGEPPASESLSTQLRWLVEFSGVWDFRGRARAAAVDQGKTQDVAGAARWEIAHTGLSPDADRRVVELARELGLVESCLPYYREVEWLLILGGARLSNLLRPQYAAQLLEQNLHTSCIVLLGGSRHVMDTERDATNSYAPGAVTEFDLLTMAAATTFGFDREARREKAGGAPNTNASWRIWEFPAEATDVKVPVVAIEAPSVDPANRRATTADSYAFFARQLQLVEAAVCLLVTSQIYVPYQHLEAVRSLALPFKLELETVGFPQTWQAALQGMQGPVNFLQEIRSTILAALRLYQEHIENVAANVA